MALRNVSDFVRKNGSELAFAGCCSDKSCMNGNETSGKRKRVDGRITNREKEEGIAGTRTGRDEFVAETHQVVDGLRVIQIGRIGANFDHDLFAELMFLHRRQGRTTCRTEVRQIVVLCMGSRDRRSSQNTGETQREQRFQSHSVFIQ